MLSPKVKAYEVMLRRMAQRQGLELKRSRLRDIWATDYGRYALWNGKRELVATKFLTDIEAYLKRSK